MRKLIQDDPKVLARFDKDGNGVIDGDEWDEVRQLVVQRLERQEAEAQEASRAGAAAPGGEAPVSPQGVAEQIYQRDLVPPPPSETRATSIIDFAELVLQQQGGVIGQLMEGMTRRSYKVLSPAGQEIGTIQQAENEALLNLGNRSILELPDLHFSVWDALAQQKLVFQRSNVGLKQRMGVQDLRGREYAFCEWKPALLGSKYAVHSVLQSIGLTVSKKIWKPFTLDILDAFDEQVGSIDRGWSGLGGFLSGGNQMHMQVDPSKTTPELRWALLATMLLTDLAAEQERR